MLFKIFFISLNLIKLKFKRYIMSKLLLVGMLIGFISYPIISKSVLKNTIKYASIEKGNQLLMKEDDYTESWGQFDIDSRMQKKNSTKEELLEYATKQTREWTIDEKKTIDSIIINIDNIIEKNNYNLKFPDNIHLIKTTAKEEGGAMGYTRENYIVLKDDVIFSTKVDLTHLILHELFHVLSRNNPQFRKELYEIIGFKLMENIEYPESLKDYRISNPDATQTDSYITLTIDDKEVDCMMIMYSNEDYESGVFFDYVNIGFLSLKGGTIKTVEYLENQPVIYGFDKIAGFFEQIGINTEYIIHPEEIMAENFSLAILGKTDLPSQELVEKIKVVLKR